MPLPRSDAARGAEISSHPDSCVLRAPESAPKRHATIHAPSLTRPRGVTPVCKYQLSHLSDGSLLSGLKALIGRDRETTAELLAHLAEVDQRKLYLPAAYPSMFAYCVGELHLSEDAAAKRIQAARAASRFPIIFEALAGGRLHLSAVCLLAPHLTAENATDLIAAATHRS